MIGQVVGVVGVRLEGEKNRRQQKSCHRGTPAFVSWLCGSQLILPLIKIYIFVGVQGRTVCFVHRGGGISCTLFRPSVGLLACLCHEDIDTQRSSRDVTTAAHLFGCEFKTI